MNENHTHTSSSSSSATSSSSNNKTNTREGGSSGGGNNQDMNHGRAGGGGGGIGRPSRPPEPKGLIGVLLNSLFTLGGKLLSGDVAGAAQGVGLGKQP